MTIQQKLSAVAAAAALTLAAGTASADIFPDFRVDPDLNPATNNSFMADKIVGGYTEVITFNAGGTFNFALRYVAGQFFSADGTNALAAGDTRLGVDYNLYALVTGSGTYSTAGTVTTFNTTPGGSLQFYYDALRNTAFTNSGAAITDQATLFARTNTADDLTLLTSGAAVSGSGQLNPALSTCGAGGGSGINCGSFGQQSSILLNNDGRRFFTFPVPFYTVAFNSGQLNNFTPTGTQVINGSVDVTFNSIPEPSALALVGVALFGLGYARRRAANK